jgi:hypothetical protein
MKSEDCNPKIPELLRLSDKISVLPIVHGSGPFANTVIEWLLDYSFDCVAIPLPKSFQKQVELATLDLPRPSVVIQRPSRPESNYPITELLSWDETSDDRQLHREQLAVSYVPIDPCQGVIAAIRASIGEHIPREFIDLEVRHFESVSAIVPDPYAVRDVSPEKYAAALLPMIPRPSSKQMLGRFDFMARRLKRLEQEFGNILFVTSVLHWPWIRESFLALKEQDYPDLPHDEIDDYAIETLEVDPRTYPFLLGELPFITALYERSKRELTSIENVPIDGVKELLLAARNAYQQEMGHRGRRISSTHLTKCLQYIRNLSLIQRRLTPDLVTIVTAAQQTLGDAFALQVAELANQYMEQLELANNDLSNDFAKFGIDQLTLPDGTIATAKSRLPNPPVSWKKIKLHRNPHQLEKSKWQYRWNPFSQCSYPPEDQKIENFRTRVFDRAKAILGNDLARTEKFTTSIKDGIDIRDTLRHWHEQQIYVRVNPPNRGNLDACVMLFDSPADPRVYQWRTTWFAEHHEESTLAFFATHFSSEMIGPGIGVGTYGGALFLYPPVSIKDIWSDIQLDFTTTLEERLIAAACLHSRGKEIALLSALPPGNGFRKLAKRYGKHFVHVPLSSFGDESIQQLRRVHVLNGKEVRSYAEEFIRKP